MTSRRTGSGVLRTVLVRVHLAHRLVEHLHVELEAERRDVAGLLVAEQVAGAAQLEVAHRDLEAGAQLGVVATARTAGRAASGVSAAALGYSRYA